MGVKERLPLVAGALIALLCQVMVAPSIHVGMALPNFILAYIVALAAADARAGNYVTAFILGLAFDLVGSEPVGALSMVCVVMTFAASHALRMLGNDATPVNVIVMLLSCIMGELLYGLLMISSGIDASLMDALVYRVLPCGIYDMLIGAIAYPLVMRFVLRSRKADEMKIIDSSVE